MELKNKIYILGAVWCNTCAMVKPQAHAKITGLNEIDVDENPEVSESLGIMSLPTIVDNREGKKDIYSGAGKCLEFINKF